MQSAMSRISLCLLATALAAPCGVKAAPTDPAASGTAEAKRRATAVATYDGGEVTVGEIEDAIRGSSPVTQDRSGEPEGLYGWLERNLVFELELQEAERRGYGANERVVKTVQDTAIQFMLDADVDKPILAFQPSQEQLMQYFQEHRSEIAAPELRRVTMLVVDSSSKAHELLPRFKAAKGQALRELVQANSLDEASRKDSGYSRYFDREGNYDDRSAKVAPQLAQAAFALPTVDSISDVFPVNDGRFAIIRLAAIRPAYEPTFEQALPVVRKRVVEERRSSMTEAVANQALKYLQPVVHDELLELLPAEIESAKD